ncbi:energy transducer TonB family protein [Pseudoduganella violaceinigra]|uniref:energy transducer TonB family protein n=1 Tax=Pseudoduganella violaceinigra TaxID=246602 RepID=UPI0012B60A59|nr:energy transducer TonB [Pseudoduganella violaceinigra]
MTIGRSYSFQREPWRLSTAVVISGIIHALLLSITLGGHTFGLPSLKFPWQERRLGADDLQVLLLPARPAAPVDIPPPIKARAALPSIDKPASAGSVAPAAMPVPVAPTHPTPMPSPAPVPASEPAMPAAKKPDIPLPTAPAAPPIVLPTMVEVKKKQPEEEALERAREQARLEQEKLAAEKLRQSELIAEAQREATRQEQVKQKAARTEQAARIETARIEAERQELARQETLRKEQAKQEEMTRQEQLRQEAARAEQAARADAARKEAERNELARQENLRREAIRQEQARQEEKSRQEAAHQEAERKEAARQEQVRQAQQDAARQDAAKQEAARLEQARKEQAQLEKAKQEAEREERLRAIGRQLNEEAAQRDAALKNPSRSLLPTVSGLRRGWLFGRADPNADLVQYAEAMSKKFELNMAFDMLRELVKQRHVPPMVTVAIRADGSVEKVTFVVSSGVPAIDEAIRKVIATYAPFGAFPPALSRQYDVIEVRRTWVFDTAIRLQ